MQASSRKGYLSGSVSLCTHVKGKERRVPVWELRYRLPNGKASDKVIGKAWLRKSRPAEGFLTKSQAEALGQAFLDQHAESVPEDRKTFRRAADEFLLYCKRERGLRPTTLHDYTRMARRLGERPWRGEQTWDVRPLESFSDDDILAVREELLERDCAGDTLNHVRRVMRGILGTQRNSPALAWDWMAVKPESEGKLRFYDPDQITALKQHARDQLDADLFTLAVEAGPRQSEILALKIVNCDFEARVVRFEDAFTYRGGHAGTKGHRVRSVPMSDNVHALLRRHCHGRSKHYADGIPTLVFERPGEPGRPLCGISLYRRFVSACERAGLPRIRFHDLRHSFGTQAIRKVDIYALQRLMGHRHITTTERYLHYKPDPELGSKLSEIWASDQPAEVIPITRAA